MTEQKNKLTSKTWFIILMFIVFFPVGITLMWVHEKFHLVTRIVITALIGLTLLSSIFSENETVTEPVEVEEVETVEDENQEEKEEQEEAKRLEDEKKKEAKEQEEANAKEEKENEKKQEDEKKKAVAKKQEDEKEADKPNPAQEQAIGGAENYISLMHFSKKGLIEQLEFDGHDNNDATYAVEKLDIDFNEQAGKAANSYLDMTSFSRSGLIEQLEFDGFTSEQANYGVDQTGL